jgi:hypothetical protein
VTYIKEVAVAGHVSELYYYNGIETVCISVSGQTNSFEGGLVFAGETLKFVYSEISILSSWFLHCWKTGIK